MNSILNIRDEINESRGLIIRLHGEIKTFRKNFSETELEPGFDLPGLLKEQLEHLIHLSDRILDYLMSKRKMLNGIKIHAPQETKYFEVSKINQLKHELDLLIREINREIKNLANEIERIISERRKNETRDAARKLIDQIYEYEEVGKEYSRLINKKEKLDSYHKHPNPFSHDPMNSLAAILYVIYILFKLFKGK